MTPFPTTLEDSADKLIGYLYRGDTDAHCGANAAWHIVGFGLAQVLTHPQPVRGVPRVLDDGELKAELEALKAPRGAFDWGSLLKTLIPILLKLIA